MIKNQSCHLTADTHLGVPRLPVGRCRGSLSFIQWVGSCAVGSPGAETKQEKLVTNCKVLKQQPDCFFFTYCAQYGLALLWQFRDLRCCQEKQTKPSRQNKWMKRQARRNTKNLSAVNKRIIYLLTEWWKLFCEEGVISGNAFLLFCCLCS